ncbi:unnamed protein product [Brassicogethes aeneus]|uniref:SH2 domain-containing protein n=1 Tax=Brassicogethes aeneus TaxID=1431903 RepID=A0A9P0FQY4_BRAAE|nr:unnamed protein product [Brassicogethes aeneus]
MLEQILRDMYIDPELLELLDETQKQTLYCKMREEQVRRWKSWNDKLGDQPAKPKVTKKRKNVSFMKGVDGEPWVWVMGEHENDKSIEEILREEALEKARQMAEIETKELRKKVEAMECISPKITNLEEDIYCSIDELRNSMNSSANNSYQNKVNRHNFVNTKEVLQDINRKPSKVSSRVAQWEIKLTETRTSEILKTMEKKNEKIAEEAELAAKKHNELWLEQEKKAKVAEQQIREIARRAREEHRLSTALDIDANYSIVNSGVPPGKQAVVEWYKKYEKARMAGLDSDGNLQNWFHGLITRTEAEKLLLDQPHGTFLVRLSERVWGYAISYRAKEKCKHYLINASQKYKFAQSTLEYNTLGDLISNHFNQPLTGGEKLLHPCPRISNTALDDLMKV